MNIIQSQSAAKKALEISSGVLGLDSKFLSIEEVLFDNAKNNWLITVGYYGSCQNNSYDGFRYSKEYKVVTIGGESGDMVSIEIKRFPV